MTTRRARPAEPTLAASPADVADRLHSAAIHLLRRLRRADDESGLSAPRLSALSVVVMRGPLTLGELAAAEQVRPPTMTRLVTALEADRLVNRRTDPDDGRLTRITATARGRAMLARARARRARLLEERLELLPPDDLGKLGDAASIIESVARTLR